MGWFTGMAMWGMDGLMVDGWMDDVTKQRRKCEPTEKNIKMFSDVHSSVFSLDGERRSQFVIGSRSYSSRLRFFSVGRVWTIFCFVCRGVLLCLKYSIFCVFNVVTPVTSHPKDLLPSLLPLPNEERLCIQRPVVWRSTNNKKYTYFYKTKSVLPCPTCFRLR